MEKIIDPFEALPGVNMLCERVRNNDTDVILQARLIMDSSHHGNSMLLQSNNVISRPHGLYWK
jgi:hypothetical protein